MGKILIIKGADFSENDIEKETFLEVMGGIVIGSHWDATVDSHKSPMPNNKNTQPNRASQTEYVDISSYQFGEISLKAKTGYKFAAYFGNTNVQSADNANLLTWTWYTNNDTLTLNLTNVHYALIMFAKEDGTDFTSNNIFDYIEQV